MTPASGGNTGAVRPLATAGKAPGISKIQKSEEAQSRPLKPVMDEYVRSEPQEPSGRYWMGKDENGRPKIYFDDRPRAAAAKQPEAAPGAGKPDAGVPEPEEPARGGGAKGPEKRGGEKEERCMGNTDKVDHEIKKLKKKRQELKRRLDTETGEARSKDLERQLAQVERELKQKDNDSYRRQHATFTQLS